MVGIGISQYYGSEFGDGLQVVLIMQNNNKALNQCVWILQKLYNTKISTAVLAFGIPEYILKDVIETSKA